MSSPDLAGQLRHFGERVRGEIPALLRHYQAKTATGAVCYLDQPGKPRRIRPWCDALEIGAAFRILPGSMDRKAWINALRGFQDPVTGLVPEYLPDDRHLESSGTLPPHQVAPYNTMIVNYALECFGSSLAHPVFASEQINAGLLEEILATLDWANGAWGAGHWIDCYASCLSANQRHFGQGHRIDDLFRWLDAHVDLKSGLWGQWRQEDRWLQPVNGFYRLTRGTYAQFGRPLPLPEKAIDTILLHSTDPAFFAEGRGNACNVLDVVHPLWLCLRQTDHRRDEAEAWVRARLPQALTRWHPSRGLAFDPAAANDQGQPGLQGTEMTLSIIYLMADLLGLTEHLSWIPRGVHRLPPATTAESCF